MLYSEFIIADLAFHDRAGRRPSEAEFYEIHGRASVVRPVLARVISALCQYVARTRRIIEMPRLTAIPPAE